MDKNNEQATFRLEPDSSTILPGEVSRVTERLLKPNDLQKLFLQLRDPRRRNLESLSAPDFPSQECEEYAKKFYREVTGEEP